MRGFIIGIIILVNFVFESTLYHSIAVRGVKPDVTLIIIVAVAILKGKDYGAIAGMAAGILQDVIFGKPVGLTALSYMFAGYLVGFNSEKIFKENFVVPVVFTAGATVVRHTLALFFYYAFNLNIPVLKYVKSIVFIELLYNCVISIPVYAVLQQVFMKEFARKGFKLKRSRRI